MECEVGLFFYINSKFLFYGIELDNATSYGDCLIYTESHLDIWDKYNLGIKYGNNLVDYDYYPRGRVVYRTSDNTFVIYYDKCISSKIPQLAKQYEPFNICFETDEHYCCHNCNTSYII